MTDSRLEARFDELVTFCLSKEAIAKGRALAASLEDQAVTDERTKLVKFLRKKAEEWRDNDVSDARLFTLEIAGMIANGEHVHGKPVPLQKEGGLPS